MVHLKIIFLFVVLVTINCEIIVQITGFSNNDGSCSGIDGCTDEGGCNDDREGCNNDCKDVFDGLNGNGRNGGHGGNGDDSGTGVDGGNRCDGGNGGDDGNGHHGGNGGEGGDGGNGGHGGNGGEDGDGGDGGNDEDDDGGEDADGGEDGEDGDGGESDGGGSNVDEEDDIGNDGDVENGGRGHAGKKIVCYYASWSVYRPEVGKFEISDIKPELCTHIVYAFAGVNDDGLIYSLDETNDIDNDGYINCTNLRRKNPSLKVMLAVGGASEGSSTFTKMAKTELSRQRFADSVVQFLIKYKFDGLDVDWEFPGDQNGSPDDKNNFISLLQALRTKFSLQRLLLSAAVSADINTIQESYNIKPMCGLLDFLNLMSYDMQDPDVASIQSPLKWENFDDPNSRQIIVKIVDYYKNRGCPLSKIIIGIPAYGRTFTLKDPNEHDVGALVTGNGPKGPYTEEEGFLGYNEICEYQKYQQDWHIKLLQKNAAIYAWRNDLWISYDDPRSIAIKGRYVCSNSLGGLMFWSIDTDDFNAICSRTRFPLLTAAKKALNLC